MLRHLLRNSEFEDYYSEILEKANPPHLRINHVIEPLREIVFRFYPVEIVVSERQGNRGNACWVEYRDRWRYFTYHHASHEIVIKNGRKQGEVLARITNETDLESVVVRLLGQ